MENDAAQPELSLTVWSAPNPFGEPSAFALVHPTEASADTAVESIGEQLGLKRLDAAGDIPWVGTDTMYASLRAMRVELCAGSDVWIDSEVTDSWTGNAVARRYVVLAVGKDPLPEEVDAEAIAEYLTHQDRVYTGLVKIRLRTAQS